MKNAYSAFMAFFIPFSMAIMLMAMGSYVFQDWKTKNFQDWEIKNQLAVVNISSQHKNESLSFPVDDWGRKPLEAEDLYVLFIVSLFILSFTLPVFIAYRSKPIERIKINYI